MGWREKGRPAEHAKNWMADPWAWRPRWCGKRMTKGGYWREPDIYAEFCRVRVRGAEVDDGEPPLRSKRARLVKRLYFWDDVCKQQWRSWKYYRDTQYKVVRTT